MNAKGLYSLEENWTSRSRRGFDFGEVARRELLAVHGELLKKALAYNICVTTRLRREAAAHAATTESVPMQAAS